MGTALQHPLEFFHPTPPPWLTVTSPHNPPSSRSSGIRSTTSTVATFISWSVSFTFLGSCISVTVADELGRSKITSIVYIVTSSSVNRPGSVKSSVYQHLRARPSRVRRTPILSRWTISRRMTSPSSFGCSTTRKCPLLDHQSPRPSDVSQEILNIRRYPRRLDRHPETRVRLAIRRGQEALYT